jgi:hypothetical protein
VTRRSNLSFVPDAAESPPADRLPGPSAAHGRLAQLRQALQETRRKVADLGGVLERCENVQRRGAQIRSDLQVLEREAAKPMAAWVLSGAHSEPPRLSAEQQTALDEARRASDQAERDAEAVAQTLPTLQRQQSELLALIPQIEQQIRQAAALAVLEDAHQLRQQLKKQRQATYDIELTLYGLRDFLVWHGAGTAPEFSTFTEELIRPAAVLSKASVESAADEWTALFNRLIAGEE